MDFEQGQQNIFVVDFLTINMISMLI